MRTKDRKKERLLIFSIIIGMIIVLVVWGFQLHNMFTNTLAKESEEVSQEYQQTIEELELFANEFEQRFPEMTQNYNDILDTIEQSGSAEQQTEQEAQMQWIAEIASEAALNLQEQTEGVAQDEESLEGISQEQTIE